MFLSPSCSNDLNMQMETTCINTTISTQTKDMNITKDKCVGSKIQKQKQQQQQQKTQYKAEHLVQTNHDLHDTKVLKVKIYKKDARR